MKNKKNDITTAAQNNERETTAKGGGGRVCFDILDECNVIKNEFNSRFQEIKRRHKTDISISTDANGIVGFGLNYDAIGKSSS